MSAKEKSAPEAAAEEPVEETAAPPAEGDVRDTAADHTPDETDAADTGADDGADAAEAEAEDDADSAGDAAADAEDADDAAPEGDVETTAEDEAESADDAATDEEEVAAASGETEQQEETEPKSRRPRGGAHARRVTPRQRLRALVAPQANKTQAVIALACLVLGFGLSVQVQSTSSASSFASLRQSELVSLLDRLTNRQDHLRKEISRLQQEKTALSGQNGDAARKAAQDRQDTLGILAGTEPATGPGIELTITDPHHAINAADLLNAVEELRDSGAEVIQIGSVRIGTDSYFLDTDGGVLADGQKLVPPYRVLAIGDPHTMGTAMNIPGGVLESLHRSGAEGTVRESQTVSVTAIREP